MGQGAIHVGIGGWTFEPWRGTFYPPKLPHARELEHAATRVTAIEINGTYYRTQKPESFANWAKATPPGFVFTVKASRYCTNRKALGEAGESIDRFLSQGPTELGDRLGPILWQLMPTKSFDGEEMAAFLALLPAQQGGLPLRHAIEVRHNSFRDPAFVDLARAAGVAIVYADSPKHPSIADPTADFIYARLQDAREEEPTGYDAAALDRWAGIAASWSRGEVPADLPCVADPPPPVAHRDVFVFMINGAKVRAPAAAEALISRL
jgi:uncharacterized protein YecE (DUF72 family)